MHPGRILEHRNIRTSIHTICTTCYLLYPKIFFWLSHEHARPCLQPPAVLKSPAQIKQQELSENVNHNRHVAVSMSVAGLLKKHNFDWIFCERRNKEKSPQKKSSFPCLMFLRLPNGMVIESETMAMGSLVTLWEQFHPTSSFFEALVWTPSFQTNSFPRSAIFLKAFQNTSEC